MRFRLISLIRGAVIGVVIVAAVAVAARPGGAQRPAATQQTIQRGWPLAPDGSVKIHNLVGRVRIVGWDRDSVAVNGTVPATLRFYGGGGRSGVKLGVEGDQHGEASAAVLTVRVPATANVAVRGASTDIEVEGLLGTVDLATVSGRLHATGSPRALTVETMDGALTVLGSPEVLRARTASGALVWEGTAREATLTTVDGPVRVSQGPLERARVETISGRITVNATLQAAADLSIQTHGGSIDLTLGAGTPIHISADAARISGDHISVTERRGAQPGEPRVIELNTGVTGVIPARVTIRSFKGHLILRGP